MNLCVRACVCVRACACVCVWVCQARGQAGCVWVCQARGRQAVVTNAALALRVAQERPELARHEAVVERNQEQLVELKRARKLLKDLPRALEEL